VIGALALLHFFVPFFLLLFRTVKLHIVSLTILASVLFLLHIVDIYWLVMPAFHPDQVKVSWMDLTAPIGFGGVWLAFFFSRLKSAPLLLLKDPGLQFAFRYGH